MVINLFENNQVELNDAIIRLHSTLQPVLILSLFPTGIISQIGHSSFNAILFSLLLCISAWDICETEGKNVPFNLTYCMALWEFIGLEVKSIELL